MAKGNTKGITGKNRIGCYGTGKDDPTKAPPQTPAIKDTATIAVNGGSGRGTMGAGKGMRSGRRS